VIELEPSELADVSSVTPAIRANCRSSGVVTLEAMVSALAPGKDAETWMVGKSTCGSGAIGSIGKLTTPITSNPAANSVVPIGRRMNGSEMLISARSRLEGQREAPPGPSREGSQGVPLRAERLSRAAQRPP
jgi:hypothetical protein